MMPLNRESLLRTANFVTHGIDLKDALSSTRALNRFPFISFLPSNSTINQMQQSSHSETLFRNLAPHGSDAEMSNRQFVAWIRDVASKESRFSYLCNRYLRDHLPIYAASETLTQAAHLVTSELPFLCSALNQSHPVLSLLTSHLYLQARGTKLGSFPEVMQEWYSDIATHTESALLCVESFFCTLRLRAGQPTELFGRFLSAWKSDIQTLILENLLHANTQALIAFYASDNFLVQMVGFPRPTTVSIEFIEAEISKFTRSYECFNFTPLERYADMLKNNEKHDVVYLPLITSFEDPRAYLHYMAHYWNSLANTISPTEEYSQIKESGGSYRVNGGCKILCRELESDQGEARISFIWERSRSQHEGLLNMRIDRERGRDSLSLDFGSLALSRVIHAVHELAASWSRLEPSGILSQRLGIMNAECIHLRERASLYSAAMTSITSAIGLRQQSALSHHHREALSEDPDFVIHFQEIVRDMRSILETPVGRI